MSKYKVLIADSASSVRQFIRYSLVDYFPNIEINVAPNGKNIKQRLENTHYDLILYEREMPILSGDELLVWIRNHEKFKSIPVIIVSTDRGEESLKKAKDLGANAYLIKPLLVEQIVNKVREVCYNFDWNKSDRRKFEWKK